MGVADVVVRALEHAASAMRIVSETKRMAA
jgi:hypothetical protein